MPTRARIDVSSIELEVAKVQGLADRVRDLSPVLAVYAELTRSLIDDSFETSTAPSGEAWAPLAPATIARRRNGSSKPLVDTARLRNSIVARASRNVLSIGTNVEYAPPHQLGAPGMNVPARPFLPFVPTGTAGEFALEERGRAGEHFRRLMAAVREYILTGRII